MTGSPDIDNSDVRKAIERVENIEDEATLRQFKTGQEVNSEFADGWEDPYSPNSIAIEYETTSQMIYYRAHGPDNQVGGFLAQKDTLTDSSGKWLSDAELKEKLSLKDTPTQISEVEVPEGYDLRAGSIKANFGGDQGATQIELIDDEYLPEDNYQIITGV